MLSIGGGRVCCIIAVRKTSTHIKPIGIVVVFVRSLAIARLRGGPCFETVRMSVSVRSKEQCVSIWLIKVRVCVVIRINECVSAVTHTHTAHISAVMCDLDFRVVVAPRLACARCDLSRVSCVK